MFESGDLFRQYAKVVDMCEGTYLFPQRGVKVAGQVFKGDTPSFTCSPSMYEFAVGICEDKFVWEDSVLYDKETGQELKGRDVIFLNVFKDLYWTKPKKKTFMLNGEELPLPDNGRWRLFRVIDLPGWSLLNDRDRVQSAILRAMAIEQ